MESRTKTPLWVYLSIAFVVLQLLDGLLTSIGMHYFGMELEGNPVASYTFMRFGVYQSAILWKLYSFLIFFGFLWYSVHLRYSTLDLLGFLWGREPKRDYAYSMFCFNIFAVIVTLASLYAGGGWIYILIYLGSVSWQFS